MQSMLLVGAICGAASKECTSSTCADADASSLLQAGSLIRKHQTLLADPDALLQTVQKVANSLTKGAAATMSPEDVNTAIGAASAALENIMPTFEQETVFAHHEVEMQLSDISACSSSAIFGEGTTASHLEMSSSHRAARDACAEALPIAEALQAQQCDEWTSHAGALYNAIPNAANGGCSDVSNPEQLFEIANNWARWVSNEWELINSQRNECNQATTAATDRAELCAALDLAFTEGFCRHSASCTTLTNCYSREVDVYNTLRADLEAAMVVRQQQFLTVSQSDCILQLIISAMLTGTPIDDDSLTSCGDVSVDHLAITFPDPPPAPVECPTPHGDDPECDAHANNPCDADALAKCEGHAPCIDLRESDNHHHLMWLNDDGTAHVDGEAHGIGAGDQRTWTCTRNGNGVGLVGSWNCPGFYTTTVTITADFAGDFTDARTNDHINVCAAMGIASHVGNSQPAAGSPPECRCSQVELQGDYSAGPVIRCDDCLDVQRTTDQNSCPSGWKIFSPRSEADWEVLAEALGPHSHSIASPTGVQTNWPASPWLIVDVTRATSMVHRAEVPPAMNSANPAAGVWTTADGSPWWLRADDWGQPDGNYAADCYLDIFNVQPGEMGFDDHGCNPHSSSYLCQLEA